ncbi:hypothetical protein Y5W_01927 [Alcanivorax sp. 521-1]|uniref:DUF401 family protein n=1 Tax=Alloalcanivorax profundimaris TaxID=2735259 RepID=A0ABS0ARA9_9GAMM|nr:hypothetical protein [Alloalcanivorax profundimaris]MBF5056633.1 hypothetical protein [Alloalcanivorax profundimaris]
MGESGPDSPVWVLRSLFAWLALVAGVLLPLPGADAVAAVAVTIAMLLGWRDLRPVARMLLALMLLAALAAALLEPAALREGVRNMAILTALIISVILLSAVLGRSRDLARLSSSLFAGRAVTRYYSLTFGTAFLSIPLNFGAVGVVAALVADRINSRGHSARTRNAARATLRGFAAAPLCSPLSISVAVVLTFLPGLQGWQLIGMGLPVAVLFLLAGALFREPEAGEPAPAEEVVAGAGPWLRFTGLIGVICAGTLALSAGGGLSYPRAVTLSCLSVVVLGLAWGAWRGERLAPPSLAPASNELVIVGASAFLGALVSALAEHHLGAGLALPGWGYPLAALLVPWVFYAAGMMGFNPILTGTLVGALLGPIWPPSAIQALGLSMVCGWAMTGVGTPYAANVLLLERFTGYPAWRTAAVWNRTLAITVMVAGGLLAALLTLLLT